MRKEKLQRGLKLCAIKTFNLHINLQVNINLLAFCTHEKGEANNWKLNM